MKKDLFDSARTVTKVEKIKKEVQKIALNRVLDVYAILNAFINELTKLKETYYKKLTDKLIELFAQTTIDEHVRPDNFKGVGIFSEATCELRKRGSNQPLNIDEMKVLKTYGIRYKKNIIREEQPETYYFNPDIVIDQGIRDKISAALSRIPELKGQEIILKQDAVEKKTNYIVDEVTFDDVANSILTKEKVIEVYNIIANPAVRPKLTKSMDIADMAGMLQRCGIKLIK